MLLQMNNNFSQKQVKWVFLILLLFVLGVVFGDFYLNREDDKQKAIREEFVLCVSAVCLNKKVGQQCVEMSPVIARIVVAEDSVERDAKRLIIETGNECSVHN